MRVGAGMLGPGMALRRARPGQARVVTHWGLA